MKTRKFLLLLVFLTTALAVVGVSCKRAPSAAKPADVDYYTCTMHPSVKSQDPNGKCPICGMNLVLVKKRQSRIGEPAMGPEGHDHAKMLAGQAAGKSDETLEPAPSEFIVPVARQQQIGVNYASIGKRPFHRVIRAVGLVAYDKQRHWDYVARVEGYVQKLEVASRGERVRPGQPLLSIYSPDLLTTQQELLDLLRMRDEAKQNGSTTAKESAEQLIESAKRRLGLWNITPGQIAKLETARQAEETLTLYSPFDGVVQNLPVDQGRKVMIGDHLVDIADLSAVWVWAQFYQDELPMLKQDLPVTITVSSYPGEKFDGKIAVIDPFINDALRMGRVRIEVGNADFKLRPDMYVDVELTTDMGEGVAVPVSAVLPTGRRYIVFVDKGEGKLEPRFIELGRKYGDFYEVKSGLQETERVVNSANFLIDAEAKVQGALKNWSEGAKE